METHILVKSKDSNSKTFLLLNLLRTHPLLRAPFANKPFKENHGDVEESKQNSKDVNTFTLRNVS